jgi:hypothetical protein
LALAPGSNDAQRAALAGLHAKSGPDFNEAHAQQALKDHDEAVSLFSAAGRLEDKTLAEFARQESSALAPVAIRQSPTRRRGSPTQQRVASAQALPRRDG